MNKKKILSLCLVVCLAATAIIGGTLAYFTDTEQATNTMVIGNVEINIEEIVKKTDGTFEDFKDDEFTLYPIDDAQGVKLKNKIAHTFNTSSSEDDAYIRTIVLFENNPLSECKTDCCANGLHFAYYDGDQTIMGKKIHGSTNEMLGVMNVDGKDYYVVVFTAADGKAIPYGEALSSINGVWMDKDVTQEQAAEWGDKVDVIVFSQAIQATGLDHEQAMTELGTVDATNLSTWIGDETATINDIYTITTN